ncbi:MAG: hypothetical protein J6D54_02445 [Olsenella sp.]|nr:hypothetical protein [Olsenella sp.]
MLDKTGIIRRLAHADAKATSELERWRGLADPDPSAFAESIRRYVLCKFLLDDEDPVPETHDLRELSMLSVEKAGRLNPNEATLLDVSRHCGSTSSHMTKKVLLLMALAKHFDISYAPYDTADIETTDELARIVGEKVAEKAAETAAEKAAETAAETRGDKTADA